MHLYVRPRDLRLGHWMNAWGRKAVVYRAFTVGNGWSYYASGPVDMLQNAYTRLGPAVYRGRVLDDAHTFFRDCDDL